MEIVIKVGFIKPKRKQIFFIMFTLISILVLVYVFQNISDDIIYSTKEFSLPSETHNMNSIVEFPPDAYYMEPCRHPKVSNAIKNKYDIIVVTGASSNHFCPLKSLLYRLKEQGTEVGIIVYDFGLKKPSRKEILRLKKLGYVTEFRALNFSAYPSFWSLKTNKANRGEYGWKIGAIAEVARDYHGKIVVWMDSGTMGSEKYFANLKEWLPHFHGFISPASVGPVSRWTHPGVYEYFHDNHTLYDDIPKNCAGGSIAFDTNISQYLINDWYKCALNKDCIAPPGSSRKNHRQDQALLTYLVQRRGILCRTGRDELGVATHLDGLCKEYNRDYEEKNRSKL
ncbi:hypothetical protein Glove_88g33 [Diversispora epigaea]|uniref:DUF1647 domain-containing protein n=1 Tax=Diversispora epigaea TaxID=1348612 RepID=A0A397JFH8_9GLOM|nr:hypothetical protein Glove_88g33 [Diversispora epigaea]